MFVEEKTENNVIYETTKVSQVVISPDGQVAILRKNPDPNLPDYLIRGFWLKSLKELKISEEL